MLNTFLEILYPLIFIACGIAIVIRFRGSLGAILGGIAFGLWLANNISRTILGALDVEWWEYNNVFIVANLAAWGCLLAAIITGRTESGPINARAEPDETVQLVDPQLAGIGGWLILPAIGLVLTPIISVLGLAGGFVLFEDMVDAGYGGIYAFELLVQVGLLVFLLYAAARFFGKKINAPVVMIALMIASVAISCLLLVIELGAGADEFVVQTVRSLFGGIVSAAIWIPYFRVSKRVKATFVN